MTSAVHNIFHYCIIMRYLPYFVFFQDPASLIPAPSRHPACMEPPLLITPRIHCCLSREPQRSEKWCRLCPPLTLCSWGQLVGRPDWNLICNSTSLLYSQKVRHVLAHLYILQHIFHCQLHCKQANWFIVSLC